MAHDSDDAVSDYSDGLDRRQRRNAEASSALGTSVVEDGDPGIDEQVTEAEVAAAREARQRRAKQDVAPKSPTRNLVEWVGVIVGAVLIAVVVRTFVFQTFWIPSESMSSTLVKDDRVLVNKLSYKLHDVNRGDVVVFERPTDLAPSEIKDLIKRVVGLPGERISITDGEVHVDGRSLSEPYINGQPTEPCAGGEAALATEAGLEIPDGQVLVMGDNRSNSDDGRCFGPIDEDLIIGRAFVIMWPLSKAGGL